MEVLVQAFDRLDEDSGRTLLAGVNEKTLYDAALTVMMRLVFLFSAEEREIFFPLANSIYDECYAASTLREQLREVADQFGEEVLERRHDAWARLLGTFRAIHGGVEHENMRLLAYGGTLFDPDRYPFLEGRALNTHWRQTPANPLAINNRVVLHLLESLQVLEVKVPGGGPAEARRLSFRGLDIEQIGHVYEGLLDHAAVRAGATVLGLQGTKDKEPEIPIEKLEELRAQGEDRLVEFLREETGRSESALRRALREAQLETDSHKLLVACRHDSALRDRVVPFAGLIRDDSFQTPVVIHPGSMYVTEGNARRSTGTHYTPRSLTEPIVQHTLEPLVYQGPSDGLPKEQWQLKSPKEILALRVCDMTMGSGAFLVQACRYLSERLAESWENVERTQPEAFIVTPEGDLSTGAPSERLLPKDSAERLAIARRFVADRCLFGVDINPMAVEMAKLSLWLVTMQRDRPFTFLNHALKWGDSLLGLCRLRQLEKFSLDDARETQVIILSNYNELIRTAIEKRRELEMLPSSDAEQIVAKEALNAEAEERTSRLKLASDLLIAAELTGGGGQQKELARTGAHLNVTEYMRRPFQEFRLFVRGSLDGQHPFHWPLEFPEIFEGGGFDAFVGNPPFMGGTKLEPAFGRDWREFLVNYLAGGIRGVRGTADLCAYFFLRAAQVLRPTSCCGLVATNSIAEGDTLLVGLDRLTKANVRITRAVSSMTWPGEAAILVALVWLRKGEWKGRCVLDDVEAPAISSALRVPGKLDGRPKPLVSNSGKVIEGAKAMGMGFVLDEAEARSLIKVDPKNRDVLFPFLTGQDLNSRADQTPSRWTIYFFNWPLDRQSAPAGYNGPVAADYPSCLSTVEERVKPERLSYPPDSSWNRSLRDRWWLYGLPRPALLHAMNGKERVLVRSAVSNLNCFAFCDTRWVFSHATKVFIFDDFGSFAFFQSDIHTVWLEEYASRMKSDIRYTPETCFDTLPLLALPPSLAPLGQGYYDLRRQIMQTRQEGLTKTYNRFHDRGEKSDHIVPLRALHVEMDQAVAAAYGWTDLDLDHGFHETKQGVRYTIGDSARRVVLDRLLALNHERYEEELKAGLHDKKSKLSAASGKRGRRAKDATSSPMPMLLE